jgi:hypothetical protein
MLAASVPGKLRPVEVYFTPRSKRRVNRSRKARRKNEGEVLSLLHKEKRVSEGCTSSISVLEVSPGHSKQTTQNGDETGSVLLHVSVLVAHAAPSTWFSCSEELISASRFGLGVVRPGFFARVEEHMKRILTFEMERLKV